MHFLTRFLELNVGGNDIVRFIYSWLDDWSLVDTTVKSADELSLTKSNRQNMEECLMYNHLARYEHFYQKTLCDESFAFLCALRNGKDEVALGHFHSLRKNASQAYIINERYDRGERSCHFACIPSAYKVIANASLSPLPTRSKWVLSFCAAISQTHALGWIPDHLWPVYRLACRHFRDIPNNNHNNNELEVCDRWVWVTCDRAEGEEYLLIDALYECLNDEVLALPLLNILVLFVTKFLDVETALIATKIERVLVRVLVGGRGVASNVRALIVAYLVDVLSELVERGGSFCKTHFSHHILGVVRTHAMENNVSEIIVCLKRFDSWEKGCSHAPDTTWASTNPKKKQLALNMFVSACLANNNYSHIVIRRRHLVWC